MSHDKTAQRDTKPTYKHEFFPGDYSNHDPRLPANFSGWAKPWADGDVSVVLHLNLFNRETGETTLLFTSADRIPLYYVAELQAGVWNYSIPESELPDRAETYLVVAVPSSPYPVDSQELVTFAVTPADRK